MRCRCCWSSEPRPSRAGHSPSRGHPIAKVCVAGGARAAAWEGAPALHGACCCVDAGVAVLPQYGWYHWEVDDAFASPEDPNPKQLPPPEAPRLLEVAKESMMDRKS